MYEKPRLGAPSSSAICAAVQREIEMRDIPTVLITVSPEVSAQMRPPRAVYLKGFRIGRSLGKPEMRDLQKRVLTDAVNPSARKHGAVKKMETREYAEYDEYHEPPAVGKI
ncbi:MAG TPA: hypothetical protein VF692_15485 [Pyrinomonadaceae bacterium]